MVLAGMAISALTFAQGHHKDHKSRAELQSDKMKKELSLSDDQYSRVQAINKKFDEKRKTLRSDTTVTVGFARNQSRKLIQEQMDELQGVLTVDQWNKWVTLKTKRMKERNKRWRDSMGRG